MLSLLPMMLASTVAIVDPPARPVDARTTPTYLLLEAPERRVRTTHPRLQAMLVQGISHSPTFASLLTALAGTDVIVYIESTMSLPKETLGRLTLVPVGGRYRYLRVQIRGDLPFREAIPLIAHEMRHALEVAEASEVRDPDAMIKLYERIGHSSGGDHTYDTIAAQDIGRQVKRELAGVAS